MKTLRVIACLVAALCIQSMDGNNKLQEFVPCSRLIHSSTVYAQQAPQPTLTHRLRDVILLPPNRIEFDIWLVNTSSEQIRWANGTFYLVVSGVSLRNAECLLESSALPLEAPALPAQRTARTRYEARIQTLAVQQSIAIAFAGPDEINDCILLRPQDSALAGRFRIELSDNLQNIGDIRLAWRENAALHQASSYKTASARTEQGRAVFAANDNIPMLLTTEVAGVPELFQTPQTTLRKLVARYQGDKRIVVQWEGDVRFSGIRLTDLNAGFVIRRGERPFGERTDRLVRFSDTVVNFRTAPNYRLTRSTSSTWTFTDSVPTRNQTYVYELSFHNASGGRSTAQTPLAVETLGVTEATTRNAVLSSARITPNPASGVARLVYTLEDRAILEAALYDVEGRLISTLLQSVEQPRGEYSLPLDTTTLAFGTMSVVLTALPINDASVERSRAVVVFQVAK
jgi:hypothetical protein